MEVPTTVEQSEAILEKLELHDPNVVQHLFHEVKSKILNFLIRQKATLRTIAKELNINPGTIKRHLVDLNDFGLIRVVSEEQNEFGINQIYYRAVAKNFIVILDYQKQIDMYLRNLGETNTIDSHGQENNLENEQGRRKKGRN